MASLLKLWYLKSAKAKKGKILLLCIFFWYFISRIGTCGLYRSLNNVSARELFTSITAVLCSRLLHIYFTRFSRSFFAIFPMPRVFHDLHQARPQHPLSHTYQHTIAEVSFYVRWLFFVVWFISFIRSFSSLCGAVKFVFSSVIVL